MVMSATKTAGGLAVELPFQIYASQLEKLPPCQARCPNSGDIRSWIGIIAQRDSNGLSLDEAYDAAWQRLAEFNPMPATIGRICPHPCEDLCSRADKDGAVSINAMERFLGDWALSRKLDFPAPPEKPYPESVGVIGTGPASLSFAYQMARRGYPVTMYDKDELPGGMLRHAIPDYRLPSSTLDAEIARILALGIARVGTIVVGKDISLEQLRERHAMLFLGLGAQAARALGIPGEKGHGVFAGIDYLRRRKQGEATGCGRHVLVIGGGNTAIDAARSARREGASVTLVYRRTESEMPAARREVLDASAEGIEFRFLSAPTCIVRDKGNIRHVEIQGMRLAEPDDDGRRRPVPVPGEVESLPADTVIVAVSQAPGWLDLDPALHAGRWLEAADDGRVDARLFSGGDDLGPGIASRAVGQGRYAAQSAHAELRGLPADSESRDRPALAKGSVKTDYYAGRDRSSVPRLPRDQWLSNPDAEIDLTLGYEEASDEAARCMSCGLCFDCQQCFMYCNPGGFTRVAETRPGRYFVMALDACEGCGKCIEICPCGYLGPRDVKA